MRRLETCSLPDGLRRERLVTNAQIAEDSKFPIQGWNIICQLIQKTYTRWLNKYSQ